MEIGSAIVCSHGKREITADDAATIETAHSIMPSGRLQS